MTLKADIQNRLVADSRSILEANLDRVEPLFRFHEDGSIAIQGKYRALSPENRILIYLIAQRFAKEGELHDKDALRTNYFYKRIDQKERTIREYLQNLREDGLITKDGRSEHRVIAENLPDALDRLESAAKESN